MITIEIEQALLEKCPKLKLGVIQSKVITNDDCPELWSVINPCIQTKTLELSPEIIRTIPEIESSKNAYRALGKDPNRYRLSAESLLRRIANGKGLYKINNLVDLLNLVSIESGFSIGGYDADKIEGKVKFGVGNKNETYQGIGRGDLNIERLPVFRDEKGAFGSPTSDSVRTSITNRSTNFLMIIISFQGELSLQKSMDFATSLLTNYAQGKELVSFVV